MGKVGGAGLRAGIPLPRLPKAKDQGSTGKIPEERVMQNDRANTRMERKELMAMANTIVGRYQHNCGEAIGDNRR